MSDKDYFFYKNLFLNKIIEESVTIDRKDMDSVQMWLDVMRRVRDLCDSEIEECEDQLEEMEESEEDEDDEDDPE